MMDFKAFGTATKLIAGIGTMHMMNKGQLHCPHGLPVFAAQQLYSLAA